MNDRISRGASAAKDTADSANQANSVVRDGRSLAEQAMQAMGRVQESAEGIDTVIEGLDKIAFQTRVLAMNAAVEAGRAGEAGVFESYGLGLGEPVPLSAEHGEGVADLFGRVAVQLAAERDVKAELVHHVGIAPARQQRVLTRVQSRLAALVQLRLGQRGAERVQCFDRPGCQRGQRVGLAQGRQRQEAAQPGQRQPVQRHRRLCRAKAGEPIVQCLEIHALGQSEGRLDRAVQPVFARGGGDFMGGQGQAVNDRRVGPFARRSVPAQPGGAEIGQWTLGKGHVDSVTGEMHDDLHSCRAYARCA